MEITTDNQLIMDNSGKEVIDESQPETIVKEGILHPKDLLVDYWGINIQLGKKQINEAIDANDGRLIIKNIILQRANSKNQNGRIYPKDILVQKVEEFQMFIREKRAYGELDHPDSQIVEIKNACITIERTEWIGDILYGDIEVLIGTPSGDIVRAILEKGKTLGISSRALGSVREISENTVTVESDLELIAWDIVSNPSTIKAFIKLQENLASKGFLVETKYSKVNKLIRDIICDNTCELSLRNK